MPDPQSLRTVNVLAIDDDPGDLAILKHHLSRVADLSIEVHDFVRPKQALASLERMDYDVVLLDYQLGDTCGLEVFEEMRLRGFDLPTILITNQGDEEVAVTSMHAGIADYLPKDVASPRSLRRSILNALDKYALLRSLAEHREDLERTVVDLRARNEEIQNFYHSLSHELKTPLTSIREFVAIVLDGLQGPLTADQRESLERSKGSCDHMVRCIDDILDASRMETGKLTLCARHQPILRVAEAAMASLRLEARERGIELREEFDDCRQQAWFDENRIRQVLANLIGNALKFTERGGEVVVRTHLHPADPETLLVSVRDTGRGIPAQEQGRIFDRLYQTAEGDAALRGGLGLGLNLCQELVRLHGGEISVESETGKGSEFTFSLRTRENPSQTPTERTQA